MQYAKWESPETQIPETKKVLAVIHGWAKKRFEMFDKYRSLICSVSVKLNKFVARFVPMDFTVYGYKWSMPSLCEFHIQCPSPRFDYMNRGKKGHINSWHDVRHEMEAFVRFLLENEVGKDIFLLGDDGMFSPLFFFLGILFSPSFLHSWRSGCVGLFAALPSHG